METTNRLMKIGPMARKLGVNVRWLRAEAEAGRIPALRAEKVFLFDPDTVIALLAERARKGDNHGN
jgi:DNA-binding transcriptional MerR regulator